MQTVKATLFILICITLLGGCGLKGPLYLGDKNPPAVEPEPAPATDGTNNKDEENDTRKNPVSH